MRFAVIGHPVTHSKSPAMHAAAYRALGLEHEHTYDRIDTPPDQLAHRVSELRHHDLDGLNVTVPHKAAVLGLVDHVAPTAKAIGAANTLVRNTDGSITAHNTDAPALAEEIERLFRTRPETRLTNGRLTNRSAVVIGSGGAARAAVFALGMIGVTHVTIRARRPLEGAATIARAGTDARSSEIETRGASPIVLPAALLAPEREREDLGVIVQCTTAGMEHGAPGTVAVDAVAWSSVPEDCIAYDVVYAATPFLERARALRHDDGSGMLVAQGALAFALWLGISPPRDVMRAALEDSAK